VLSWDALGARVAARIRRSSPLGVDPVQGAQAQGVDPRTRQVARGPSIRLWSIDSVHLFAPPFIRP